MKELCLDLRHVSFEGRRTRAVERGVRSPAGRSVRAAFPEAPAYGASDAAPDGLAASILGRAGLDAGAYRGAPLTRRVPACLRALGVRSVAEAEALLLRRPDLVPSAVDSLLIGVTTFFRDTDVFESLRANVLPALARRARDVRVWSVGCSSGAELFSVAVLLAEAGLLDRVSLVGTDCRASAIADARAARYDAAAVASVSPRLLATYFEPDADGWRPSEALRVRTSWEVADAQRQVEPGPWDLVLFRNAAIYMNLRTASDVCARLAASLAPGGFLVLGKAERPPAGVGLSPVSRCLYRKSGGPHVG